ncbi:hypothetical protein PAXINDRAFT_171919 [Paxillus involutus ATCC 200175]|uniref:Uncharacterized protein n=1 Tax=Paxillus involutus ATCC 200175 TaxID=664439 RepID=A0A0C9TKE6_PAXIN|nr:hypothetical protein PAXINDRAFT_171919 [Paxillus involutus ATCC 200175]
MPGLIPDAVEVGEVVVETGVEGAKVGVEVGTAVVKAALGSSETKNVKAPAVLDEERAPLVG